MDVVGDAREIVRELEGPFDLVPLDASCWPGAPPDRDNRRAMAQESGDTGRRPSGDWTRANLAIAVGWAALAVVFGAYAIVRESVGAGVLTLVVMWCMRLAWVLAWRGEEDEETR